MAKNKSAGVPPKLTEAEPDLLTHMAEGYNLETDSLGGTLVLRRLKDDEAIRPLSANRNTIKAFEERDLIRSGKGHDPRLPYIVFCAVNTNTFARGLRTSALIANAMGSRRFGMPRSPTDV